MTPELFYLLLTTLATALFWIPVVVGYAKTRGPLTQEDYVTPPTSPLPDWVKRANRAHMNALENLALFSGVVFIGHLAGVTNKVTVTCAMLYFIIRIVHYVMHLTGFKYFSFRTVLFTSGWIVTMVFGVSVLLEA